MKPDTHKTKYQLRLCPFCRKPAVFIGVHDYEGNYHGRLDCEYESNPWSGLSYALHHEGTTDCLLCSNGANEIMGHMLYDTAEEAANAWNNQTVTSMLNTEPTPPTKPQLHQIAIDGPAAAGKTTMAKRLAEKLEYLYIDTGAMYRVIALHMLRQNMPIDSIPAILKTVNFKVQTENDGQHIYLDGEDVTDKIRTQEISRLASDISAQPAVREYLLHQQRQLANAGCVVMEGRDIGSVILPDADIKFYLTADLLVRAKRRFKDELEKGLVNTDPFKLVKELEQRDYNDSHRATAPLVKTPDAILIDNSNLTIEETEAVMMAIIKLRAKS